MNWTQINFLKISEKAAIKASEFKGILDKNGADKAATDSMREELNLLPISATVVIGEGEMDEAPMLYIGEKLGRGGDKVDIAVDPLEGTNLAAKNQNNAITILALTDDKGFLNAPDMYMKKLATGAQTKGLLDIRKSLSENLKIYQKATQKPPHEITVAMLDRERHNGYMHEVIEFGAKLLLFSDGDILPGILTALDTHPIDILFGIGAAPEGVITAAALKCLQGDFQGILVPSNEKEIKRCQKMGIKDPVTHVFERDDLAKQNNIVVAMTAVTDGFIGKGVSYHSKGIITESLLIQSNEPYVKYVKSFY
jgi:fructose-1,6-bisphosphatase II